MKLLKNPLRMKSKNERNKKIRHDLEVEKLKHRIYLLELVILKLATPFENEDPVELARIAVQCYKIPFHGYENDVNQSLLD